MKKSDRIIHPRRSNRAKMLGRIEDTARLIALRGETDEERAIEKVEELLGWSLEETDYEPTDERYLALSAFNAERSKMIAAGIE